MQILIINKRKKMSLLKWSIEVESIIMDGLILWGVSNYDRQWRKERVQKHLFLGWSHLWILPKWRSLKKYKKPYFSLFIFDLLES